jgi:SAM-dependent methyltransferase
VSESNESSPLRKTGQELLQSELFSSVTWKLNSIVSGLEAKYRLRTSGSKQFTCPICLFEGRFVTDRSTTGSRFFAYCPQCGSAERHRLQFLAMGELRGSIDFSNMSILHIAPEASMGKILKEWFGTYATADLNPAGVDFAIDLTSADVPDDSYDVLYASHVLEHIPHDHKALAEIARIVKPGGFAVLPVPLVGEFTIEYDGPVHAEFDHVRAPGYDYFDRFGEYFSRVQTYSSPDFDERFQTFIYEDRSRYPTPSCPYRMPSQGARHRDVVPVAFV